MQMKPSTQNYAPNTGRSDVPILKRGWMPMGSIHRFGLFRNLAVDRCRSVFLAMRCCKIDEIRSSSLARFSACLTLLFVSVLSLTPMMNAQSVAGRLVGTVTDPTGAMLPGAVVTVTNRGTGNHVSAKAGASGEYAVFPIEPGDYDISVQKEGFRTSLVRDVAVDVNAAITRDFHLALGSASAEVSISGAEAPPLQQNISVETIITENQLTTLPLNGRDFNQLVLLAPGATDNTVATGLNLAFGSYALSGNQAFANEYLVDGVTNDNPFQGSSAAPLSVDAIQQFKVVSGVPTAEYGHGATAISAITKSGTNALHGRLIEYYRGDQLLAENPFDNLSADETFLRNQFGGSLGGPVVLPHYDGRTYKTFFFVDYEGTRQSDTATRVDTVPQPAFWSGDFSTLLARGIQLRDPFTTGRPNITGNRLDLYKNGALIDPKAQALRAFFPDPNQMGNASNSIQFPSETVTADQFTARVDQNLPKHELLSVRYIFSNTGGFQPNFLGHGGVGLTEPMDSRNGSVTWTVPIGGNQVNELRFAGMNYSDIASYTAGNAPTVTSLGLQGFELGDNSIPLFPKVTFSGTDAFTTIKYGPTNGYGEAALSMVANIWTLADTYTISAGKHTFKIGFEGRRDYYNVLQQSSARGSMTFTGSATSATSSGYSLANLLMGLPSSTQQVAIKPKALLIQNEYAGFAEDDWRLASHLTVELGLRYELSPSPTEQHDRLAIFDPDLAGGGFVVACKNKQLPTSQFLPSVVAKLTNSSGAFPFPVVCGSSVGYNAENLVSTGAKNFGPRLGLVWDPTGSGLYSIHAGYGIVYSRYPIQYFLQTALVNPPFAGTFPFSQKITSGAAALTLDAPYGGSGSATVTPLGIARNFSLPDNQQWNLALERSIHTTNVVSLRYVGNKGTHLFRSFDANQPFVNPNTGVVTEPLSANFGTTSALVRHSDGNSTYNAMTIEFRRRAARGLNLQANWTWAKAIDDLDLNPQAAGLDAVSPGADRGNSAYARRHQINVNSTYQIPFGRGLKFGSQLSTWEDSLLGGWLVSGIWHWNTGLFLTPTATSEGGLSNTRPDVVPGVNPNLPRGQRTREHWFNAAAFVAAPLLDPTTDLPRFGNASRNTVIGPGLDTVDFALRKAFRLRNAQRVSVEMNLFNALNHPNWGTPDMNISDSTVASITAISKPMRETQFAVRYDF
jgi:hypothetical protein